MTVAVPPPHRLSLADHLRRERGFAAMLTIGFAVVGLTYRNTAVAAWVGFALSAYSCVANDSIQTLGVFLSSNRLRKWWMLWLFVGGVFAATTLYGWFSYGGDVSYARLSAKGFSESPTSFSYLQVAAPLFLLILTRFKIPVSTTFLILSSFASKASGVSKVLIKSLSGYVVAFGVAIVLWPVLSPLTRRLKARGKPGPSWTAAQWVTTGFLWAVWLMQDAANIAVYLPRKLSSGQLTGYVGLMLVGLALLMLRRGGRIQAIVTEKSDVLDVRPATFVNIVFSVILYVFKVASKIPMSTTWVFIGLLAGRELAIRFVSDESDRRTYGRIGRLLGKDVVAASIGFAVSLVLAVLINPVVWRAVFG